MNTAYHTVRPDLYNLYAYLYGREDYAARNRRPVQGKMGIKKMV